ncbi:hypothetical protein [[Clostridium] innocuum]|uniref:hypothetical protein n=1 Tax=Clostridium innocuum TaxID=1522 RepID=UPI0032599406
MVKRRTLLLIAGVVWTIAGFNILKIGIMSYVGYVHILNLVCSSIIFLMFWVFIFNKLVVKHTTRIAGYEEEKKYFWNFFDISSFIIMAFMITVGVSIRSFNLLPNVIIAVFYTGLGLALFGAGIKFMKNYLCYVD